MPQKAKIDSNFEAVLKELARKKREAGDRLNANRVVPWFRPTVNSSGWAGGLQSNEDLVQLHRVFNTDEAEEALIDAYQPDPKKSGNTGDNIVLPLQIDYMAQAERAFRARHSQGFPRAIAHLTARSKGHGNEKKGIFNAQVLDYIKRIIVQAAPTSN